MDVDQLIQDDALKALERGQRDARLARRFVMGLLVAAALGVTGWVYRGQVRMALAASPPAYSAQQHRKKFMRLMAHRMPQYVVAVSGDDGAKRQQASLW